MGSRFQPHLNRSVALNKVTLWIGVILRGEMGVNMTALKSPSGLLKIVALVLTLIVLIIARKGFPNSSRATYLDTDHSWLTIIAVGALAIQHHDPFVGGAKRDTGLAMGSIAIIDGAVMLADALFLAKATFKK